MVEPSDNFVKHIQEMMQEKRVKDVSYEEAWEGAFNLLGFFNLLYKIDCRNKERKNKQVK
jgi:hypothetical protein